MPKILSILNSSEVKIKYEHLYRIGAWRYASILDGKPLSPASAFCPKLGTGMDCVPQITRDCVKIERVGKGYVFSPQDEATRASRTRRKSSQQPTNSNPKTEQLSRTLMNKSLSRSSCGYMYRGASCGGLSFQGGDRKPCVTNAVARAGGRRTHSQLSPAAGMYLGIFFRETLATCEPQACLE